MSVPEARILQSAEGYLELGMIEEGLAELTSLPGSAQERADVLELKIHAFLHARNWREALEVSGVLCRVAAGNAQGFIHAAFCLHELGRTVEAKAVLLSGPTALLQDATYYYNLGCYDAVLGNVEEAQAYLRASFKLDKKFRDLARHDPDLASVRELL